MAHKNLSEFDQCSDTSGQYIRFVLDTLDEMPSHRATEVSRIIHVPYANKYVYTNCYGRKEIYEGTGRKKYNRRHEIEPDGKKFRRGIYIHG
jgi:hypothetical protein